MARGAHERGDLVAFGSDGEIRWDHHSELIFRDNPNIAKPGQERIATTWIPFYRGNRLYNREDKLNERWIWNMTFQAQRGEMFFSQAELVDAKRSGKGFVIVEPHAALWKTVSSNKTWPADRFQAVVEMLRADGHDMVQLEYHGVTTRLRGVRRVETQNFRQALAVLRRAALIIVSEGGLHHGAAAVSTPAVVLFGGFIPPQIMGYDGHVNLAAAGPACGRFTPCQHCEKAIRSITVESVLDAARGLLARKAAA